MATKPNGAILYQGPSRIDGAPIVVIITGLAKKSGNGKTGSMLQTWILRSDIDPQTALRTGADISICGNCKHRPIYDAVTMALRPDGDVGGLGTCYVRVYQAPLSVYRAFKRGTYPVATPDQIAAIGADREVRVGSYGDPYAAPIEMWQALVSRATKRTGYTHQWMQDDADPYAAICMASADNADEREMAQSLGYRTFTVRTTDEPLAPRESVCPASKEAGHILSCQTCGACNGSGTGRKGSIAIVVHGAMSRRFNEARV